MNSLIATDATKVDAIARQMKSFVDSGFLPEHVKTAQQAFVIAQMGSELGIPPMTAFSSIFVIKGKPGLSADLMLALIRKKCPQAIINFLEITNDICKLEVTRDANHRPSTLSFSMEDAKRAELLTMYSKKHGKVIDNPNWKKYPRALLRSRCISEMARTIFPDCLLGFTYTPEELGAPVNAEGGVDTKLLQSSAERSPDSDSRRNENENASSTHEELGRTNPKSNQELEKKSEIIINVNADVKTPDSVGQDVKEAFKEFESQQEDETIPEGKEFENWPPANEGLTVLEQLNKAKSEMDQQNEVTPKETFSSTNDVDPGSSLGDYVYEVGYNTNKNYSKKLSDISLQDVFKIQSFLKKKIENAHKKNWDKNPQEEAALFMINKYLEEQKALNK